MEGLCVLFFNSLQFTLIASVLVKFINDILVILEIAANNLQLPLGKRSSLDVWLEVKALWKVSEELSGLVIELRSISFLSFWAETV